VREPHSRRTWTCLGHWQEWRPSGSSTSAEPATSCRSAPFTTWTGRTVHTPANAQLPVFRCPGFSVRLNIRMPRGAVPGCHVAAFVDRSALPDATVDHHRRLDTGDVLFPARHRADTLDRPLINRPMFLRLFAINHDRPAGGFKALAFFKRIR